MSPTRLTLRALLVGPLLCACQSTPPSVTPVPVAVASVAPAPAPEPPRYRVTPDAPFRAQPPPFAIAPLSSLASAQTLELSNGMRLIVVNRHSDIKLVRFGVVVDAAEAPVHKLAAERIAMSCLKRGTTKHNEGELIDLGVEIVSQMGISRYADASLVSIAGLSDHSSKMVSLLAEVVQSPTFPKADVVRAIKSFQQPDELNGYGFSSRVLPMALLGLDTPLDVSGQERQSDLDAVGLDDVKKAYAETVDPSRVTLLAAGDITPGTAQSLMEAAFGSWKPATKPAPKVARPAFAAVSQPPHLVFVDRPGSQQSLVVLGAFGPPVSGPDYQPAKLAMDLLGDRDQGLTHDLVENRKLIWTAYTSNTALRNGTLFKWSADVAPEHVAEVVRLLDTEVARLRSGVTPDAQLAPLREREINGDRAWSASSAGTLDALFTGVAAHARIGEWLNETPRWEAAGASDVRRVASQMLAPDRTRVLVVGDYAVAGPALLAALGRPIEVRTTDGRVLRKENPSP